MLSSIYDCDECFKQSSDNSFTYRVLHFSTVLCKNNVALEQDCSSSVELADR